MNDMIFGNPTNDRMEMHAITGTIRAGKIFPVGMVHVDFNESGLVDQRISLELAPIAGRLMTAVYADVQMIYVPLQAMDIMAFPGPFAGMKEPIKSKLLSGAVYWPGAFHGPNSICQAAGIEPMQVAGVKGYNPEPVYAYNCAVNYLRLRRYRAAALLSATNVTLSNAIVSETALDMRNAVLDPDDRINGSVDFEMPTVTMNVDGIAGGSTNAGNVTTAASVRESDGTTIAYPNAKAMNGNGSAAIWLKMKADGITPDLTATFQGVLGGNLSTKDFWEAEQRDRMFRLFNEVIEADPQFGQERVGSMIHGLSVDMGKSPVILNERTYQFGKSMVAAQDSSGVASELLRSDLSLEASITGIVPRSELGGCVVTLVTIRPDETIARQPHPFFSQPYAARNYAADELAIDPQPIMARHVTHTGLAVGDETLIVGYTGKNHLMKTYINYGFNGLVNQSSVEAKTKIWQFVLPLSTSATNINYPDNFPQYPFADQLSDCCTYTAVQTVKFRTPIVFGPAPIETVNITSNFEG